LAVPQTATARERRRRISFYTNCAAVSISCAIVGWLFLLSTWGFSSLVGPLGLLVAIPGLRSPRKIVALLGLVLNTLLTALSIPWMMGLYG
jgi:hypothetical protein